MFCHSVQYAWRCAPIPKSLPGWAEQGALSPALCAPICPCTSPARLVRPLDAFGNTLRLHLHPVLVAPAFGGHRRGVSLDREAREQRFQPRQQPGLVGISERDLHLAPCNRDVAVDTGGRFWQCIGVGCAGSGLGHTLTSASVVQGPTFKGLG